jgi:flagellar biogenesis protein FliO
MEIGQMELTQMKVLQMQSAQKQIETHGRPNSPRFFMLAAERLKILWRSLVRRAGSKRKTLSVRGTAALGDGRFVFVVQFESQRFLIGSSPSSVTLLSQLPDESASGEESGKQSRGERGEKK